MKPAIKSIRTIYLLVVGLLFVGVGENTASGANAGAGWHPYLAIVPQNVFRLHPETRADVPPPVRHLPPAVQPPSIRVTGFTDVCGRSQVLLEVTEQGKAVERVVLAQGDCFLGIEAELVDVKGMRAMLRVNGKPTEVTFQRAPVVPPVIPDLKHLRK